MSSYSFRPIVEPHWKCSCCWAENPRERGGTIAHANGGEFHPIHLDCMFIWRMKSNRCPTCLRETEADAVITSAMKLKLKIVCFLRDLSQTFQSPLFRLSAGIVFTVIGSQKKQPLLSAMGWFSQWLNIHQIIRYGGRHIEIAKKLEKICSQLILHFNEAQLQELRSLAQLHERYYAIMNDPPGIQGIKHLFETLKKEIRGDQMVRLYRLIAALSALYFMMKLAFRECQSEFF